MFISFHARLSSCLESWLKCLYLYNCILDNLYIKLNCEKFCALTEINLSLGWTNKKLCKNYFIFFSRIAFKQVSSTELHSHTTSLQKSTAREHDLGKCSYASHLKTYKSLD